MDEKTVYISDDDRRLLVEHYSFYHALDSGSRIPTTSKQNHFVSVCRGTAQPETDHEWAYLRLKRAVTAGDYDEEALISSGFLLPDDAAASDQDSTLTKIDIPVRLCTGCGRPIPPMRIEAVPNAIRCVSCQEKKESSADGDWHVTEVECPRCASRGIKSPMVWRTARDAAKSGYFLGCSRYPKCRYVDQS